MPLSKLKQLLRTARSNNWAVGAFNPVDYGSLRAVIRAAEELDAPVIVQFSTKTVKYYGPASIAGWMNDLARRSPVPVVFHLDHCQDLGMLQRCVEAGWTSVMIDASHLPFEANLAMSKQAVMIAAAGGADVEAELGKIGGVEEDISVRESDAYLADPDEAERFCKEMDLATFAPAIGTAHGVYKGEPKIAFHLIDEIYRRTQVPLALHGGTGLSDEVFQKAIKLGCAKVNISTNLKYDFINGFCDYHRDHPEEYEPLRLIEAQFQRMKTMVAEKIRQFGGAGKASSVSHSL